MSNLHDARIIHVDRAPNVLTMHFDCSGALAKIQQLHFFDCRIIEDADLTDCWWLRAYVSSKRPTSAAHTLELTVETRMGKRRQFVLRFHRVEAVPFSEDA